MLELVLPDQKYKIAYIEMVEYWRSTGEDLAPWVLTVDYTDFDAMVKKFMDSREGIDLNPGYVPHTAFWAYLPESDKMIGAVDIRHYLNEPLFNKWGNIGYGIRPDERQKGYGTLALELALEKCRLMKMDQVLLGCYKENFASLKVIENNGGKFENEIWYNNRIIQRYWIDLKASN